MALAAGPERQISNLAINGINLLLSDTMENPILEANTTLSDHGRITAIGTRAEVETGNAT